MEEFNFQEFPEEVKKDFQDSIGVDHYNGSIIDFYVDKLDGFDKRNRFVDYLLTQGVEEGDDVQINYWW